MVADPRILPPWTAESFRARRAERTDSLPVAGRACPESAGVDRHVPGALRHMANCLVERERLPWVTVTPSIYPPEQRATVTVTAPTGAAWACMISVRCPTVPPKWPIEASRWAGQRRGRRRPRESQSLRQSRLTPATVPTRGAGRPACIISSPRSGEVNRFKLSGLCSGLCLPTGSSGVPSTL